MNTLQVVLSIQVSNSNEADVLQNLQFATQKFEESFDPKIKAELTQIIIGCKESNRTLISIDNLSIDTESKKVEVNGNPIILTTLEFRLLSLLASNRGTIQSRETILEKVWNINPNTNTRTIDVHVKRLRTKLLDSGSLIKSVSGRGYIIY